MSHNDNHYSLTDYVREIAYFTLYGLVKYLPGPLFSPCRWLVLKPFMRQLQSWRIMDGVTIWFPGRVSIGRNVSLNEYVHIQGFGGVTIGNDVRIAHGVSIVSEDHGIDVLDKPMYRQKKVPAAITIGDDVWIGAGARILKGVTIGNGAVIGAGAVVTRDVPPLAVMAGNPARLLRRRGEPRTPVTSEK